MGNLNSPQSKTGKAEIISFILLVLLSAAVFIVWNQDKNQGDKQKHSNVITPGESKINLKSGTNFNLDTVPAPEMPDVVTVPVQQTPEADKPVPLAQPDLKKLKPSTIIAPPLPAYEIRLMETVVHAETGESITTTRNSQIIIPPNAFVDARGKVVEGRVKVSYREYHDFHDIFFSGIPMEFENGMLESAGMIEIQAAQNNEPLYVNPENKIQVTLASTLNETDYNLYYLDQKDMKWEQKGKDEIVLTSQIERPKSEPALFDSIEKKFYFEGPRSQVELICRSDMRARKKFWFSRKNLSYVFDFTISRTRTMPSELKALSGITWRYYGKDAQDVYMRLFGLNKIPKQTINMEASSGHIYVTEDLDAGPWTYQMHFTVGRGTMSIPVVPVFRSERSSDLFMRRWKKYSEAYARFRYAEQIRFEKFQADTVAYFTSNERYERFAKGSISGEVAALRTFEINNFGIWNCDRPIPAMPNTVTAAFTDEIGNPLKIQYGYLVVKSRNTVYAINNFKKFPLDSKAQIMFWAVLPGNKLAVAYPEEFTRHEKDKGRHRTFTMEINTTALDNISELKSALSFN